MRGDSAVILRGSRTQHCLILDPWCLARTRYPLSLTVSCWLISSSGRPLHFNLTLDYCESSRILLRVLSSRFAAAMNSDERLCILFCFSSLTWAGASSGRHWAPNRMNLIHLRARAKGRSDGAGSLYVLSATRLTLTPARLASVLIVPEEFSDYIVLDILFNLFYSSFMYIEHLRGALAWLEPSRARDWFDG